MGRSKNVYWIIGTAFLLLCLSSTSTSAWAQSKEKAEHHPSKMGDDQNGSESEQGMMPNMMGGGMMPMMSQMMQGMMPSMQVGPEGSNQVSPFLALPGLMGPFHAWTNRLLAKRDELGLTQEQLSRLDRMITDHIKFAIQNLARAFSAKMDLQFALRQETVDLAKAETILREIVDYDFALQQEGIKLYTQVLDLLTDSQREKMRKIIGSPFPPPWGRPAPEEEGSSANDKKGPSGMVTEESSEAKQEHHLSP